MQAYHQYGVGSLGGRSQSTRREPSTMGKQLVNFITCGCESSAPFLQFTKAGANHDIAEILLKVAFKAQSK
jgi:hypothetical protein